MNNTPPIPPAIPPVPPEDVLGLRLPSSIDTPEDREPIGSPLAAVESMLRQPRRMLFHLRQPGAGSLMAVLLLVFAACGALYGFVVGTFSGETQLWAAPVKVALSLFLSALICLPSLYIFACLGGSKARLIEVVGLVCGLLALTTVLLIGFAPVAWVFSQSTESLGTMGALHLLFGLVAVWFGLRFLGWGFGQLGTRHTGGIALWMVLFVIVVLQMTTALRPIVGTADTFLPQEKKFFLKHWMEHMGSQQP